MKKIITCAVFVVAGFLSLTVHAATYDLTPKSVPAPQPQLSAPVNVQHATMPDIKVPGASTLSDDAFVPCNKYFDPRLINVTLQTGATIIPGSDVEVVATIENKNTVEVTNGGLYVKLVRNMPVKPGVVNEYEGYLVDQFVALPNFDVASGKTLEGTFHIKIPAHLLNGSYSLIPSVVINNRPISFAQFQSPSMKTLDFTINGGDTTGIYFDPASAFIGKENAKSFGPLPVARIVGEKDEIPALSVKVVNTTKQDKDVVVRWSVYRNDATDSKNLMGEGTTIVKVKANSSAIASTNRGFGDAYQYHVIAKVVNPDNLAQSLINIKYLKAGISDVGLGVLGTTRGGGATREAFVCYRTAGNTINSSIVIESKDGKGGILSTATIQLNKVTEVVTGKVKIPSGAYTLSASAYSNSRLVDRIESRHVCLEDCDLSSGQATSTSSIGSKTMLMYILIIIALIGAAAAYFIKRRKSTVAPLAVAVGFLLLASTSVAHAAPLFNGASGKTSSSVVTLPTLYGPWATAGGSGVEFFKQMYAGGTVTQFPSGYVAVNGTYKTDDQVNHQLNVGDTLWITPGWAQREEIMLSGTWNGANSWGGSPQSFSNYGYWMDDTTFQTYISNPRNVTYDSTIAIGEYSPDSQLPSYSTVQSSNTMLLRAAPRSKFVNVSGSAGATCNPQNTQSGMGTYLILICTITSPGTFNVNIHHNGTTADLTLGVVARESQLISREYSNVVQPISSSPWDPIGGGAQPPRYLINLPAADVNFTYTVGGGSTQQPPAPPQPPTVPAMGCPPSGFINSPLNFTFTSTDPDSGLAYQVDWNGDGAVDQRILPNGWVVSGTVGAGTHSFTSAGNFTVKARAIDPSNLSSNWASCVVNVRGANQPPTAPEINLGQGNCPNVITSGNHGFRSTDPDGDTIRYGVDTNMDGTVDQWVPSVSYVNSGICGQAPFAGVTSLQALAEDSLGARSGWTQWALGNNPPSAPTITSWSGNSGPAGQFYWFTVNGTDPDNNYVFYQLDGDNNGTGDSAWPQNLYLSSGTGQNILQAFTQRGLKTFGVRTADVAFTNGTPPTTAGASNPTNSPANTNSKVSAWSTFNFDVQNRPPYAPNVTYVNADFYAGHVQTYKVRAFDADGDPIRFFIDWKDGSAIQMVPTSGYVSNGTDVTVTHTFANPGNYAVSYVAEDNYSSPLRSQPNNENISIVGPWNPPPTGTDPFGKCNVTDTNPVAYDNVVWSVDMGGKSPFWTSWETSSNYVSGLTWTTKYKTAGQSKGPKVWAKDALGRIVALDKPKNQTNDPHCPPVLVQNRPLVTAIRAGKAAVVLPPDSTATDLTLGSSEVIVYKGQRAKMQMKVAKGMGIVNCIAYDALATDTNAPNINVSPSTNTNYPNVEFDDNKPLVASFTTQTFPTLGDYTYRLMCKDRMGQTVEDKAVVHVVAKPDYTDF